MQSHKSAWVLRSIKVHCSQSSADDFQIISRIVASAKLKLPEYPTGPLLITIDLQAPDVSNYEQQEKFDPKVYQKMVDNVAKSKHRLNLAAQTAASEYQLAIMNAQVFYRRTMTNLFQDHYSVECQAKAYGEQMMMREQEKRDKRAAEALLREKQREEREQVQRDQKKQARRRRSKPTFTSITSTATAHHPRLPSAESYDYADDLELISTGLGTMTFYRP